MQRAIGTCLVAVLLAASAAPALAWGPLTHMSVCLEAAQTTGLPVDASLMGAFLAGATEPDLSCQGSLGKEYGVTHDVDFAVAMERLAATKPSPDRERLLARALGIRAHLNGDSVAHAADGYSNAKKVYRLTPESSKANHTTTEFSLDALNYSKNKALFDKYPPDFMDLKTLLEVRREYEKVKNVKLEDNLPELKKAVLLHRATVLTEKSVTEDLMKKKPAQLAEMDRFFADRTTGVDGKNGLAASVAKMTEFLGGTAKINLGKDDRSLPDRVVSFMGRVVNRAFDRGGRGAEKALFAGLSPEVVQSHVRSMAEEKITSDGQATVARLMMNLLWDDVTFEQALHLAERDLSPPKTDAQRLASLTMDAEILRAQLARAEADWKGRPIWKVWRYVTNSDRKKYEALKAQLESVEGEIARLSAPPAATPAPFPSPAVATPAPAAAQDGPAYRRYIEAVEGGDPDKIRAAAEALGR